MKKVLSKISIAVFLALALFLVITLALPVMPAQADSTPECWAVLVGVSNYQTITDLYYADDDARDLSQELSPVWGENHITLLIDSQATKTGILAAIEWLADNAGPDDTVLFSFSGHGASGGYLCPYDGISGFFSTFISSSELANAFRSVQAGKIMFILGNCYSGAFQNALAGDGRVILMGSRANEVGWEWSRVQNSIFGYFILQTFDQYDEVDTNNDYQLSAEEIFQYASILTTQYEIDNQSYGFTSIQHPVLDDGLTGDLALLAKFVFDINLNLPYGTVVLTLDGKTYTSMPTPMLWVPGVSHTISVPEIVDKGSGTRYVFTQWSDGSVTVLRFITRGLYTANYDMEHMLEVVSAFGETQGSGWYKDGNIANFSVTDYIELPDTRHYFTGWMGDYSGTTASASVLMDEPQTISAMWRHEYLLTLNSKYGTLTGAGWYKESETASFSVTDYIELPDTKHYFTGWSGSYTGAEASASLAVTSPKVVDANWRHEYLLTLNSEYGEPTGAGWYKEGETASLSVEPVQGIIVRHIFTGWSGDLTDTSAVSAIEMNTPKIVAATWRTDFVQLYILIGGVVVLAGAVIATVILVRRSRRVI
ncbi:MAG: hypothetical protein A2Y89_02385 [Chloroflexi bacterium RBG_13_51_18]|nr:MAG: hypothetical protein A2Y89_02385 [Chloroflexi bacterium RBG_13_51_18]